MKSFTPSIKNDFKQSWFVWIILCVGMMPNWLNNYLSYFLILLLPIVLIKYHKLDKICALIILFSINYTFFQFANGVKYTLSQFIFDLFFPFIMYQAGALVVNRGKDPQSIIVLIACMASCLSIPAIVDNLKDAFETGQMINITRNITDESGDTTRVATGYGMMVALLDGCFGLFLLKASNKIDQKMKLILITLSFGTLFATIHLLNRTGIVLAFISIIVASILPPNSLKKSFAKIFVLCTIILIAISFTDNIQIINDALESYESRDTGGGDNKSYGGRTERWSAGLTHLIEQPFGSKEGVVINGQHTYAHNTWIDAGIRGGTLCTIILIIITLIYLQNLSKFYRNKHITQFDKNLIIIFSLILILQLAMEPVIEGVPQLFWLYIFMISAVIHINYKKYRLYNLDRYSKDDHSIINKTKPVYS